MYAVIRAGGKQYRVAPGDVIQVERRGSKDEGRVEFGDILAISGGEGQISRPQADAHVIGQVVEQGRGDKILVFHYKRKKQYKKLRGHRQAFTAVRITEIAFDGQKFSAPDVAMKSPKVKKQAKAEAAPTSEAAPAKKAAKKKSAKKSAGKKK